MGEAGAEILVRGRGGMWYTEKAALFDPARHSKPFTVSTVDGFQGGLPAYCRRGENDHIFPGLVKLKDSTQPQLHRGPNMPLPTPIPIPHTNKSLINFPKRGNDFKRMNDFKRSKIPLTPLRYINPLDILRPAHTQKVPEMCGLPVPWETRTAC